MDFIIWPVEVYIHRVHPNKSPLKYGRKGSVGVSSDCPIFEYPLLSQERVKLRISNFVSTTSWVKMTARCSLYMGALEIFESLSTPRATSAEIFNGLMFRSILWMCVQNLKFIRLRDNAEVSVVNGFYFTHHNALEINIYAIFIWCRANLEYGL